MKTPRTRIADTVAQRSLKGVSSKKLAKEVAAYLLSERRVGELDSLLRDVQADWAKAGHVEVLAASAHPLTDGVRKDIDAQIRRVYPDATEIVVTEVRDTAVIGGVKITMADRQLDLSVQAKLHKFKQLTLSGKE